MDARELQRRCGVSDGHADSLMWNRDLNQASEEGHVDFPRLREAGVTLQCFTVVTRGFPWVGGLPLFARWRGWPKEARRGEWRRANWQVDRLHALCASSEGRARVTETRQALAENLSAGRLSAILGIEGAHALEGRVERVRELWARGVRFMGLVHLSNNALGGSSFPLALPRGLTGYGREVLEAMAGVGMSVDVAHASQRTLESILAHPAAQPFCSHTGIRSAGGGGRNLTDAALRRIADRGGVVGVIFATVYLGWGEVDDVCRHIERAMDVMGEDGVGLGSDFDGLVPLPEGIRDVRDVHRITDALLRRGHPEAWVEKVIGANWRRFFSRTLPPATQMT